jgi:hypothetical protein
MNVRYFLIDKIENLYSGNEKLLCERNEKLVPRVGDTLIYDGLFKVVNVCWCIGDEDTMVEVTVIEG